MAYGYIYKTTNIVNNKVYIGKHEKPEYDPTYFGSGKILLRAISKYGIEDSLNADGYKPYFKNKLKHLIGMKIFYIEDVETNGDECSHVGTR